AGRAAPLDGPLEPGGDGRGRVDPDGVKAPPGGLAEARRVPVGRLLLADQLEAAPAVDDLLAGDLPGAERTAFLAGRPGLVEGDAGARRLDEPAVLQRRRPLERHGQADAGVGGHLALPIDAYHFEADGAEGRSLAGRRDAPAARRHVARPQHG